MLSRCLGIHPGLAMPSNSPAHWVAQLVPHDQHTVVVYTQLPFSFLLMNLLPHTVFCIVQVGEAEHLATVASRT